jgi:hypothetical protein
VKQTSADLGCLESRTSLEDEDMRNRNDRIWLEKVLVSIDGWIYLVLQRKRYYYNALCYTEWEVVGIDDDIYIDETVGRRPEKDRLPEGLAEGKGLNRAFFTLCSALPALDWQFACASSLAFLVREKQIGVKYLLT